MQTTSNSNRMTSPDDTFRVLAKPDFNQIKSIIVSDYKGPRMTCDLLDKFLTQYGWTSREYIDAWNKAYCITDGLPTHG